MQWADRLVTTAEQPDNAITNLFLYTSDRNSIMDSLPKIPGEPNEYQSGRYLLGKLCNTLRLKQITAHSAAKMAKLIAQITDFPMEERLQFDIAEDEMQLAEQGIFSQEENTEYLVSLLSKYPIFSFHNQ